MPTLPHKRSLLAKLSNVELARAILERRNALRYDRDQIGDDRCWVFRYKIFEFIEGSCPIAITPPPYEDAMNECRLFYEYCREDHPPPISENPVDPALWDNDVRFATRDQLLDFLEELQFAILTFRAVRKPYTVYDYRALYAVLPEGKAADFRLPPEREFLGTSPHLQDRCGDMEKLGAGCPQFWESHGTCTDPCDLNRWGPCTRETAELPIIKRELDRFRKLGGLIMIEEKKITLFSKIVPQSIIEMFCVRIKKLAGDEMEVLIRKT